MIKRLFGPVVLFFIIILIMLPETGNCALKYTREMQNQDDEYLMDIPLARICFVNKGANGEDLVFIRIPPGMYRFAKSRAKIKRKRSLVRVVLRPRHHLALKQAIGKIPAKVMLRLDTRRMRQVKGLKGHYAVRPLRQFLKWNE